MKLKEKRLQRLIRNTLNEKLGEEKTKNKKTKKKELPPVIKNSIEKLNTFKIGKEKAKENAKDISAETGVIPNKKDPDALTEEIAALEQIAINLDGGLKTDAQPTDKIEMSGYSITRKDFMGMLYGLKMNKPDSYMVAMQSTILKDFYKNNKSKFPYSKKSSKDTEQTNQSTEKKTGIPDSKNVPKSQRDKIRGIQKIIKAPSAATEKGADGLWGRKTSAAYKTWSASEPIVAAIEKLKKEKKEGDDPKVQKESRSLKRLQLRTLLEQMASIGGEEQSGYGVTESSQNDDDLADIERMEAEMRKDPNTRIQDTEAGVGDEEPKKKKKKTYWKDALPLAKELGFEQSIGGVAEMIQKLNDTAPDNTKNKKEPGKSDNADESGLAAVKYDDVGNVFAINKKSPKNDKAFSLSAIPISYITKIREDYARAKDAESGDYKDLDAFLKSDSSTREYFDGEGKSASSNYNLNVFRNGANVKVGDKEFTPITIQVDGTGWYNTLINDYTYVKKGNQVYAVPFKDVKAGKVKINESVKDENLRLLKTLRKYKII